MIKTKTKKVRELVQNDLVDMEPFVSLQNEPLAEFEYGRVDEIVIEPAEGDIPEIHVVHFTNLSSFAFPPDTEVEVDAEN